LSCRRKRRWVCLLLLVVLLAGCWDRREIEEKSTSLATGVDLCSEDEDCTIILTRQIAIPGQIPLGAAGGGGREGDPVVVIRSPGKDGPDTARHAQSLVNRTISFGHTRVLIWSEEFARQGLAEYIDYLRRHPEARRLMWIAIAEGRAEDFIYAKPPLEQVPALFLNDMFEDALKTGRLPPLYFGDFVVRLSNEGEEAVAPLIRMAGPDRPQLAGLAVFRGYQMIGKLTPEEMVTHMQVRGLRKGVELMRLDLSDGQVADIRVFGHQTTYRLSGGPERIYANVKIEMETELVQLSPGMDSSDPRVLYLIEREAEKAVTGRANDLVEKLQTEFGSDSLALGERVRGHMPDVWQAIDDWPTAFSNAKFDFDVKVRVRRTGMDGK
jgi:spore germination protein KC